MYDQMYREKQQLIWKTVCPDMSIDVLKDELWFIQPDNSPPMIHDPVMFFLGIITNDAWSTEEKFTA